MPEQLPEPIRAKVRGASELEAAFDGHWPSFHDAEVVALYLSREGPQLRLALQVPWRGQMRNVDFLCQGVSDNELAYWNQQNVLACISIHALRDGMLHVAFEASYGLYGFVNCQSIEVEV